ncbi:MAG: hypothetical protein IPO48_20030 [Saprospiraceae bacterium]|nr:hypothetical protein [Saprospiraceae bacterium]
MNGLFSKLDPHSLYLSPLVEVLLVMRPIKMDGAYNGTGIENYFIDDTVNIRSKVLPQSPAGESWIKDI